MVSGAGPASPGRRRRHRHGRGLTCASRARSASPCGSSSAVAASTVSSIRPPSSWRSAGQTLAHRSARSSNWPLPAAGRPRRSSQAEAVVAGTPASRSAAAAHPFDSRVLPRAFLRRPEVPNRITSDGQQVGHSCAVAFDRHGERLRPDRTFRPFTGHAGQPADLRALARSQIDPQGTSAQAVSGFQASPGVISPSASMDASGYRVTMTVAWCPAAFLSLTSPVSSSQPSASASAM
jgi:hypothetical protein